MNIEVINIDLEDDSDSNGTELDQFNTPTGLNAQESTQVHRKDGDGADVKMKSEQHIHKRRKTSEVWQYFDELKMGSDGIQRIIKDDLPFTFVEYDGIRELLTSLHPKVKQISRNTTRMDVLKLYTIEKVFALFDEYLRRSPKTSSSSSSIHGENFSHSFGAERGKDSLDVLMVS
ncbi:hypothetical protein ACH5RR_024007 [Cinchona calisaya]|uniref:Uncharacterized protein n=1 Tax=Cinchona calisaya TaxID=153742 RepID=A0ABD2ZFL6_9GENT